MSRATSGVSQGDKWSESSRESGTSGVSQATSGVSRSQATSGVSRATSGVSRETSESSDKCS